MEHHETYKLEDLHSELHAAKQKYSILLEKIKSILTEEEQDQLGDMIEEIYEAGISHENGWWHDHGAMI